MARQTHGLDDRLYRYLLDVSLREPDLLRRLREETAEHERGRMQIAPEQGQFMALLVRLLHARKTIEVGVFTGYSSTVVALALPEDGRVVACDVSEEYTSIARRYWKEAGVEHKIELHLRPALEILDELIGGGETNSFDFAFIDADKANYVAYYERILALLRPGGVVAVDNVLWEGEVADPAISNSDVDAIRALNDLLHDDDRVDLSLLPLADGLTLALKR